MKVYLQQVISKKKLFKLIFVAILRVNDENSRIQFRIRIQIRIRIHLSEAWIRGSRSGSTPKCHGSATLEKWFEYLSFYRWGRW
jgi:hypothetical protein